MSEKEDKEALANQLRQTQLQLDAERNKVIKLNETSNVKDELLQREQYKNEFLINFIDRLMAKLIERGTRYE